MVNAEHGAVAGVFSPDAWNVLMTLAAFLVWQTPASTDGARRWSVARALGVVALVALAFLYRSGDATGAIQMRPHWWGILGLIGWAYLDCRGRVPADWRAAGPTCLPWQPRSTGSSFSIRPASCPGSCRSGTS